MYQQQPTVSGYQPSYAPGAPMPGSATVEVGAFDNEGFKPKTINVTPGTTVRWVNRGQEKHTVTARDGSFDSGEIAPGASFTFTFQRPGTIEYVCRPHEQMGMIGSVIVGTSGAHSPGSHGAPPAPGN